MPRRRYRPVLFAPDGAWVTDPSMSADTVEEVIEKLGDMGSRWYFYPFHGVIVDSPLTKGSKRLVDVAYPFQDFKGRSISTLRKYIEGLTQEDIEMILAS